MTTKEHKAFAVSSTWTLVLVLPFVAFALWLAIDHSNSVTARSQRAAAVLAQEAVFRSLMSSYQSGIAACGRGNVLRARINAQDEIQVEFLRTALVARLSAVAAATNDKERALNAKAASRYRVLLANVKKIPQVDCETVYTRPEPPPHKEAGQ